jgi:AmmeMemoRadiSam system protein A
MLDQRARKYLLAVARDAIARQLNLPSSPPEPTPIPEAQARAPVFVTLTLGDRLRGCVGNMEPSGSLPEFTASCAVASATTDPRFPPLAPAELARARIEISILSPPMPAAGPQDIVPGIHGIVVSQGPRRGLLLPQVATEYGWTAETFLSQACVKAGLPPDAWRAGVHIEIFTAEVFAEA